MAKKKSFMTAATDALVAMESDMFHTGFDTDLDLWIDTGNFALNRMMGGRFDGGFLYGKNYMLYGESGSGKSLMAAYLCAHAQRDQNANIFWYDVEKASDQRFFQRAGVNTDPNHFQRSQVAELSDVYEAIVKTIKLYRQFQKDGNEMEPVVYVVDSWSMVLTSGQMDQLDKAELRGDQGQKAKQTGDVITRLNHMLTGLPIAIFGIAHVYDSQELHGPRHKTTGGHKLQYAATGCLMLTKSQLRLEDIEDPEIVATLEENREGYTADLKKATKRRAEGFVCHAENLKSRVAKPFQKVMVQVPYESGMDKYSGLFNLMMEEGVVAKAGGAYYAYTKADGSEQKFFKKDFRDHADDIIAVAKVDISDAQEDIDDERREEVSE